MNRYARPFLGLILLTAMAACAPTADAPSMAPRTASAVPSAPASPDRASPSSMPVATVEPSTTPHDMGGMDHGGDAVEVRIDNFAFVDGTIEVEVGTTVTWVNGDATRHTVTSGADDAADGRFDGDIPAGGSFSVTFDEPGEYPYFCDIHPTMTGTVIVRP